VISVLSVAKKSLEYPCIDRFECIKSRRTDHGVIHYNGPATILVLFRKPAIKANKRLSLIDFAGSFYAYRALDPPAHIANHTADIVGPETAGTVKLTRNLTALRAFQVDGHNQNLSLRPALSFCS